MYLNGQGVGRDDAQALQWFRRAAGQGHALARTNLGYLYETGRGVRQNDSEAVRWYRLAAAQGEVNAQNNLGNMYFNGRGVRQSDADAVRWYSRAAGQGHVSAQSMLGFMYLDGRGVARDDALAARWTRRAAAQGDAQAQNNLAFMYQKGRGVARSDKEAERWYRKAAEQGHAGAQASLKIVLSAGRDTRRFATSAVPARSVAEPDADMFVAHVLALRAAGVTGEAGKVLANMPGAGRVDGEARLAALWAPFFDNAIVELGRLQSPAPVALYYNPLLDVALFALWERQGDQYLVASLRALPGERLADPNAEVPLGPPWMAAEANPITALARITAARLDTLRRAHPAQSRQAGRDATTFAAAVADFKAVLPRLVWNAAQRARWTDEARPWLRPALSEIEAVMVAGDAGMLTRVAPETDAETAAALAQLPRGFAAGLALDMALDIGSEEHLLIGSLPEDGDVYVLVRCRLEGGLCALRQFGLVSLLE